MPRELSRQHRPASMMTINLSELSGPGSTVFDLSRLQHRDQTCFPRTCFVKALQKKVLVFRFCSSQISFKLGYLTGFSIIGIIFTPGSLREAHLKTIKGNCLAVVASGGVRPEKLLPPRKVFHRRVCCFWDFIGPSPLDGFYCHLVPEVTNVGSESASTRISGGKGGGSQNR